MILSMTAPEIINFFQKNDPLIAPYVEQLKMERLKMGRLHPDTQFSLFYQLCQTIIGQQLSNKAAATIESRFRALFPHEPTPADILLKKPEELRAAGLSWAKVKSVIDLAERVNTQKLDLNQLASLSNEEVITSLITVKGIGPWTAEMVLLFTLGRETVFSTKDLGLKKGMQKVYSLPELPTEKQMKEIIEKWHPYESYGSLALWHALDSKDETTG